MNQESCDEALLDAIPDGDRMLLDAIPDGDRIDVYARRDGRRAGSPGSDAPATG